MQLSWRQREIENYLCFPETLLNYAGEQRAVMQQSIDEVTQALRILVRPDPFGPQIKASDDFLTPLFERYYQKLGLGNLMRKTDFHVLAQHVPVDKLDPEIGEKLDAILTAASKACPVE